MIYLMKLRVCCGMKKTYALNDNFPNAAQVMWTSPGGEDTLYIQSMSCKDVIPLLSADMVCNACQKTMPSIRPPAKERKLSPITKSMTEQKLDRPLFVVTLVTGSSHPCVSAIHPTLTTETIVNVHSQVACDLSYAQPTQIDTCSSSQELPFTPTTTSLIHHVTPEQADANLKTKVPWLPQKKNRKSFYSRIKDYIWYGCWYHTF